MHLFNRTGTLGFGLGCVKGRCRHRVFSGRMEGTILFLKNDFLWGIVIPVLIAVIRDLTNPTGLVWQFTRTLFYNRIITNSRSNCKSL